MRRMLHTSRFNSYVRRDVTSSMAKVPYRGTRVGANRLTDLLAEQGQPVPLMALLGSGDGGQDLPFLAVMFVGQIPVHRGLGPLIGQVPPPAAQVRCTGPGVGHIVGHRGHLS